MFRSRKHVFETSLGATKLQQVTRNSPRSEPSTKHQETTRITQSHYCFMGMAVMRLQTVHGPLFTRQKMITVVVSEFKPIRVQLLNLATSTILRQRCDCQGRESSCRVCQHVFELAMQQTRFDVASTAPIISCHVRYQLQHCLTCDAIEDLLALFDERSGPSVFISRLLWNHQSKSSTCKGVNTFV